MSCPSRNLEDNVLRKIKSIEVLLKWFQKGAVLTTELDFSPVIFQPRMGLHFAHLLRTCLMKNLKKNEVIFLAKQILRQPDTDCSMWLSVITL